MAFLIISSTYISPLLLFFTLNLSLVCLLMFIIRASIWISKPKNLLRKSPSQPPYTPHVATIVSKSFFGKNGHGSIHRECLRIFWNSVMAWWMRLCRLGGLRSAFFPLSAKPFPRKLNRLDEQHHRVSLGHPRRNISSHSSRTYDGRQMSRQCHGGIV